MYNSLHPYLFFDKNRKSVTHVGLALNGLEVVNTKSLVVTEFPHTVCKDSPNTFSMKITPEVQRFLSKKVNVPSVNLQRKLHVDAIIQK